MTKELQYQLRISMEPEFARHARQNPEDANLEPLPEILRKHDATLKCQFDAFADYVAEAEIEGVDGYPLYEWTRATIEDPAKQEKYTKSFTLYVDGDQVYSREKADALMADLGPLVGGSVVATLDRYDTNPANSPQPPEKFRKP